MAQKSKIIWCDATWSPIVGCTRKSPGCENCYSERFMARFSGIKGHKFEGISKFTKNGPRWTGAIRLHEPCLLEPLGWRKPRKVFVCSISDLFHEKVKDEWLDKIFAVMALAHKHTFQCLTKRPDRMLDYFQGDPYDRILRQADKIRMRRRVSWVGVSDPNISPMRWVWLGVSVEDQKTANERIPILLDTPAGVHWVSYEPALGPVGMGPNGNNAWLYPPFPQSPQAHRSKLDWVVCGGESGPGARPMHPDWVRSIRDQCVKAGVPFLFKQHGAWKPIDQPWKEDSPDPLGKKEQWLNLAGGMGYHGKEVWRMRNVGKKAAGRILDGRTWDEYPKMTVVANG